ncbi:MAG: Rne/Rng family ribonuclease [Actinobacteria bacterium]|nr:Rne/Rng family ribonuclease [Actinomycetota bacterium]
MTDEKTPEATTSETTPSTPPTTKSEAGGSPDAASSNGETPARRRRRRGSRGGRNRKKSTATAGAHPPAGESLGEDWNDPAADRGLTAEDLAADARDDAGLSAPMPTAARPKIGDTRPAPAAAAPAAKSGRRRRGGRGRNKSASGATARDDVVQADLGVGDTTALEDLDEETLARRRGRTRKGRPAGRYMMCVHVREDGHTHIALLEGRVLIEHSVATAERDTANSIDGNIYLGRVQNVLPGMEAAFVDIGTPKNGVLYRGDVAYDPEEVEEKQPKIERLLKNGQSVVVQVTKNPIGAKGARLTQEVSLAGRFVVMVPSQPSIYGISKRLPDDERKRLRRVLEDLRPPDAGLIVRTAAEGATPDELERDVRRLREQWEQISALADRSKPARLLYQEPPLVTRLLREEFTKEYRGVLIDDRALYEEVRSYVEAITPELAERIEYYDEAEEGISVFERHHVQEQLLKALDRKVWLPSGGSIIIERTEALTVVDVNTGKNVGRSNLEETVFKNNLEAADEVARQLRLRDIGGIIVIDFIDMEIRSNREQLVKAFRDALARDKTRTQVFDVSELGVVEMTRKRVSEGLVESVSETCSTCNGRGYLIDEALLEELQ